MSDTRRRKLARLLVEYSTQVQPGDWVGILGNFGALPILRDIYEAVIDAGGFPSLFVEDDQMGRYFLRNANDDQMQWIDPRMRLYVDEADVYIRALAEENTRAMTDIDAARLQMQRAAQSGILQTRLKRAAEGEFRWVGTLYPTQASAQEANMSFEEYEDFVYRACFCDHEDPAAEWRKLSAMQQHKVDYLAGKKHIQLHGPNIELELSIEGRRFINSDGKRNMPSGEIFTGPVENSVNGWVRFSYPAIVSGRAVSGIELTFDGGKVTRASAEMNEDLLQAQLNTDDGARYLGEFAIGTNFGIDRFTGSILYDEKIGGTVHMAIGMGYPETGSRNTSAVHWDMICDMRTDSSIAVDGELFYENGAFMV
ncbi:MAG: aminopeptidase [Chloroflexota bacterium]|nr:aminopeptidase [Chloroflexota bacterium]MDE2952255.1 aminopeptidase [Chloroflexota bacterium]